MPESRARHRPPWPVLAVVALLAPMSLGALVAAVVFAASGAGPFALAPASLAVVLATIAWGLWQGRRGARTAGLILGVAVVLTGLSAVGRGDPSGAFAVPAGALLTGLLALRPAKVWVS